MRQSKFTWISLGVILLAAGSSASAQGRRGGGGGGGGGRRGDENGRGRGAEAMTTFSDDDFTKIDPARVLLDKAKALKLNDQQKQALDSVAKRYDWNTHQFAKIADSLLTVTKKERIGAGRSSSAAPADTGTEERATHRALLDALQSIRDEFNAASTHSTQRLTDDQKKQAADMLQDARTKLEALLSRT